MLGCQRAEFDLPEEIVYFNAAYMGPLPKPVAQAGFGGIEIKKTPWQIKPVDFFTHSERARTLFGRLIGASAESVAIIPAVSYGIAVAAKNLPLRTNQTVLVVEDEFPANLYAWRGRVRETGASLVTVPRPRDGDWTAAVLRAMDRRTAVVVAPHCHWTDGGRFDLRRIGERARALGAALVVDGTQSIGMMPFSVAEVDPDFLVCATYKWLLGPYSYGFLHVAPRWQGGRPLEETWIARAGSEDFSGLVDYTDQYQPGARRFDVGERSNIALTPMVLAALEMILGWGVEAMEAYVSTLTEPLAEGASSLGLTISDQALRSPHLLGLRFPGAPPSSLASALAAEKIFVSVRGNAIRVAPHVYNHQDEVARFLDVLGQAVRRG